ncbi:MAG TPA: hypothetical protein VEV17_21975 [Bryobacteraceae bacterium]|nr:hypothetical protein [Bryobacteraceae bacterium]
MLRLRVNKPAVSFLAQMAACLFMLALCVAGARQQALETGAILKIAALFCFFWLWHQQLTRSGSPWPLSLAAVSITAFEASLRIDQIPGALYLTGGVLAYITVWMFTTYRRQPGLQPLATMALVICAALLANPTVAIGCFALALSLFVFNPHPAVGGRLGFAFLLFTPVTLCVSAAVMLGFLVTGNVMAYPLSAPPILHSAARPMLDAALLANELLIPIAILASRIAAGRAGSSDLALVLIVFIAAASTRWFPGYCDVSGVWLLSLGGSAFLLTNAFEGRASARPAHA